ncbi:MAG: SRPBCC family protein [Bacteroidota bacterium]
MMKIEETIVIQSPISKVFGFLSNYRSHKKFFANYKDARQLSKGKLGEGTELFSKVIFLGRKIETNSKVTQFVPEKQIALESVSGPIPQNMEYRLDGNDEATTVTLHYEVQPGSFFNMDEVFLRPRFTDVVNKSLGNLKKLLEVKSA